MQFSVLVQYHHHCLALNVGSICKDGVGAVEKAVQQAEDLCVCVCVLKRENKTFSF